MLENLIAQYRIQKIDVEKREKEMLQTKKEVFKLLCEKYKYWCDERIVFNKVSANDPEYSGCFSFEHYTFTNDPWILMKEFIEDQDCVVLSIKSHEILISSIASNTIDVYRGKEWNAIHTNDLFKLYNHPDRDGIFQLLIAGKENFDIAVQMLSN